jgi:hypothetical protein
LAWWLHEEAVDKGVTKNGVKYDLSTIESLYEFLVEDLWAPQTKTTKGGVS